MTWLTPQVVTPPRPDPTDVEALRYVRSYLVLRALTGAIGITLPFVLVLVDHLVLRENPFLRDSLSAYYYSGVRDVFVGSLYAAGAFLITYKVAEVSLENTLSLVAGLAALVVALFPTGRDPGNTEPPTALQNLLGESTVNVVHFAGAGVFIVALAVLSYYFGVREGGRTGRRTAFSAQFWQRFHWTCTGLIVAAVAYLLLSHLLGGSPRALLYTESVCALAFGASWLAKGLELNVLFGAATVPSSVTEP
jgi:hypothetical protein